MTTQTLSKQNPSDWTDGKRIFWLLSPLLPALGLAFLIFAYMTSAGLLFWALPIFFYGLIPIMDLLIGVDRTNPPESAVPHLEQDHYYRAIVYTYIPTQFAVTIFGAWVVANQPLAWYEMFGLIISMGIVNGVGINTAHELGHKKESLERWLAKLTLAPVAYGHFFVEHNKGHHRRVATPEDPASSRMGETFYRFLPRTMIGSVVSAWEIEKDRLERKGQSVWSRDNENLQAWAMTVALFGGLTVWLGWVVLPVLLVQAFVGAALLEVVNYIEHYGLKRQLNEKTGRYERCTPAHSWNSNNVVTNLFLYQLQRHADHHANPTRRYQSLRHFDESPQLPSGYASMIVLAYFPPLWFHQIDPLVAKHYDGDVSQGNLHPPKREKLINRWQDTDLDTGHPEPYPEAHFSPAPGAVVSGEGRYQCTDCGFVYDETQGCPDEGFQPGTPWFDIPEDWACPDCAVREKPDFRALVASSA